VKIIDCNIKENLRKYYNREAEYRNVSTKQEWKLAERQAFLNLAKAEGKQTLLELGAGTGDDSLFFLENGLTVTAIDLSCEMVKRCKEKGICAYELDYYQVATLDRKYECIWAMNSLLHVPKAELPQVLANIDCVLEQNGIFFMGVYGGENTENEYIREELSQYPRFFSYFSKDALQEVLAQQFEIISFKQYDVQRGRSHEFQSVLMRKKAAAK